ncbi:MAG: alpha/beta hydrolase [Alphaproteobacteria bacterium]|nr:alpha/beta hydrolase [Alphaproteobacteria bacterium]
MSWEIGQYGADAVWARSEGAPGLVALLDLLASENGKRKIDIISHSMGCLVVADAMRKNQKAFRNVRRVFWLAPDLTYEVLEDDEVKNGIAEIETLHVMYSRNDAILKRLSAALHISGMLGSSGPANPDEVPANVVVHDFTDVLGTKDVHSGYKVAGSAAAILMADTLSGKSQ